MNNIANQVIDLIKHYDPNLRTLKLEITFPTSIENLELKKFEEEKELATLRGASWQIPPLIENINELVWRDANVSKRERFNQTRYESTVREQTLIAITTHLGTVWVQHHGNWLEINR